MQHTGRSAQGASTMAFQFWGALPAVVRLVIAAGLRITITIIVARALLALVPRLERFITSRAGARATQGSTATASMVHQSQRVETLVRVSGSVARAVVYGTATVTVLASIGLDVTPVLAGAGIAGVAVGFGAQTVVKDFFGGFFILMENQYAVGDTISVGAITGTVEEMTMRVTVLRDAAGPLHFIPNGGIGTVTNRTHSWQRAVVEVSSPWSVPVARARAALLAAVQPLVDDPAAHDLRGAVELEGPLDFNGEKVTWRLSARCDPKKVMLARAALLTALQKALPRSGDAERLDWSKVRDEGDQSAPI
ncbi:MAG: mechanosensitive ion channel family protein [Deltaproteobacteria bacterium]|nr:mechanosensitive ion channel family protein [Myxococcales bacterium]MDP3221146.1 mechanosensitive ion channel family protein [Deltaproteobacteria bacterium]